MEMEMEKQNDHQFKKVSPNKPKKEKEKEKHLSLVSNCPYRSLITITVHVKLAQKSIPDALFQNGPISIFSDPIHGKLAIS
jgi:hypothetical protein